MELNTRCEWCGKFTSHEDLILNEIDPSEDNYEIVCRGCIEKSNNFLKKRVCVSDVQEYLKRIL